MLTVKVEETIGCTCEEFLAFVMDIERYAEVDKKIHPVTWWTREGDVLEFACKPRLGGIPQPATVQTVRLTPGRRIDISLSPLPQNRMQHAMADFRASFECAEVAGGVHVTRTLQFTFSWATRWFLEPLLRRRLPREVREEIELAKRHLEKHRPVA